VQRIQYADRDGDSDRPLPLTEERANNPPSGWAAWLDALATRPAALFLAFVALSVATRWLSLVVDVLDIDETAHIVGAGRWSGADALSRVRRQQAPLLYVYYLAAQWVFGRGLIAVHAMSALVVVPLTALGVSAFVGHERRGALAGVRRSCSVQRGVPPAHDMQASHAELLLMAPATWALALQRNGIAARRPLAPWAPGAPRHRLPREVPDGRVARGLRPGAGVERPARSPACSCGPRRGLLILGWSVPLAVTAAWFGARGRRATGVLDDPEQPR